MQTTHMMESSRNELTLTSDGHMTAAAAVENTSTCCSCCYTLFTERTPHLPLTVNREWGFLSVNGLHSVRYGGQPLIQATSLIFAATLALRGNVGTLNSTIYKGRLLRTSAYIWFSTINHDAITRGEEGCLVSSDALTALKNQSHLYRAPSPISAKVKGSCLDRGHLLWCQI